MKTRETRRTIIRGWMASTTDKQETEEQMQRIANAFFFGLTIFSVAFAYFVLSARAQDHHPSRQAQLQELSTSIWSVPDHQAMPQTKTYRIQQLSVFLTHKLQWFSGSNL